MTLDRALETKLEDAYDAGRSYGLRQLKYSMLRKAQLAREWRRPPVEKPW